jgi:hypothetical protein
VQENVGTSTYWKIKKKTENPIAKVCLDNPGLGYI